MTRIALFRIFRCKKEIKVMNLDNKKMYDSAIDNLLEGIYGDYVNWTSNWDNPTNSRNKFKNGLSVKSGRKFDKVMHGTSVWGFVAKKNGVHKGITYFVGDVFKAASWRGPAKHVRGSIFYDGSDWYTWTGPNYLI